MSTMRVVGCLAACAWLALLPSCGQPTATELVVVVDTDYAVPADIDAIDVTVTAPDGLAHTEHQTMARAADLPYTLGVVPSAASLGPVRIEAAGLSRGAAVVTRRARVMLVAGQTVMVRLDLLRVCAASRVTCADPDQTCGDAGTCVSSSVPTVPWSGRPSRLGTDGGAPPDAPPDAPALDTGISLDGGGPSDSGPPRDAAPDCHATGCDDGQLCTDDLCGADGVCTHVNNSLGCDDGTFCNGLDQCGGGTCSVHAGTPCGGASCDEAARSCGACGRDADCPGPIMGSFGACGGFADVCSNDGTHSRSVQTFHCVASTCQPTDAIDTEPCTRNSDGTMCGGTTCDPFGSCDAGDVCATIGSQSRTCHDRVCSGGTCGSQARTEVASCTRATDGISCGGTSCGGFGACGGFADACANDGTWSRSCTDFVCSGGGCSGRVRTDTQPCTRNTDGTGCGATTCDAWTACDYPFPTCTASGPQTRTCTDYVCGGGTCNGSARSESMDCPPAPAGTDCTDETLCGSYACNGSGACLPTGGQCPGTWTCCQDTIPARCVRFAGDCFL